ncbi:hypothetical protein FF2_037612 [Malus domestica]
MLKNQRGTALRISRARLPTGLLSSKRHCSPNLKSKTPNMIAFSKIKKAPLSESQEADSQQDYVLKNRRGTALRISRARLPTGLLSQNRRDTALQISRFRLPTGLLSQKSKRHRSLNLESQILDKIACLKIEKVPLSKLREPDFLG